MNSSITRRGFCSLAAAPLLASAGSTPVPIGLELYSVRDRLKDELEPTLRAVAKMGYQVVEFFSPYFDWTPERAKQVRTMLDSNNLRCLSTHNGPQSFTSDGLKHAAELNNILGTRFVVFASAGNVKTVDGWKKVAETLSQADDKLKSSGLHSGYHNHQLEFRKIDGVLPMAVLAENTPSTVMLQLDVGTCVEDGVNPVDWINSHPGRIRSCHLKDWSPKEGYKVLFGEGVVKWKEVLTAAAKTGGAQYFLIEQEGSRFNSLETARRCLANYHQLNLNLAA